MKTEISKRIRINPIRLGYVIRAAVRDMVKPEQIEAIGKQLQLITEAHYYDPVIKANLPRDLDVRSGLLIQSDHITIKGEGNGEPTSRINYFKPNHNLVHGKTPFTGIEALGQICQDVEERGTHLNGNRWHCEYYLPAHRLLPANESTFNSSLLVKLKKDNLGQITPKEFVRQYDIEVAKFTKIQTKVEELHAAIVQLHAPYKTFYEVLQVWPQGEEWIRTALIQDGQLEAAQNKSKALTTTQSRDAIDKLMGWKP